MTVITADLVKRLRERTGVGMGKCKEALDASNGDIEQAIDFLRKAGMASAVKKESRETNEGMIAFAESDKAMVLIEVNAETDFVVQNERFQHFVKDLCHLAANHPVSNLDALMNTPLSHGRTAEEVRAENIQSLGENIRVKRIHIHPKHANSSIGVYSHMAGKIVCLVEIEGDSHSQAIAKEVALHAVAEAPEFMSPENVPHDVKAREEDIAREQVKGRPQNIMDKIIEGKLKSFYEATCLPLQKFVKDPSITVAQYVEQEGKKIGKSLHVKNFLRWQVGE